MASIQEYASTIGSGRIVKGSPFHRGGELDIDGKIGDPVTAFEGGTVVEIKDDGRAGYGKHIIIRNNKGEEYIYGHLNGFGVKVGQVVSAGTPIGILGNSGKVVAQHGGDGSHLHIEKKNQAGKIEPLNIVSGSANEIIMLSEQKKAELANVIQRMESQNYPTDQIKKVVKGYMADNASAPSPTRTTSDSGIFDLNTTGENYPGSGIGALPTPTEPESLKMEGLLKTEDKPVKNQIRDTVTGLAESNPNVFALPSGLATALRMDTFKHAANPFGKDDGSQAPINQTGNENAQALLDSKKTQVALHKLVTSGVPKDDPRRTKLANLLKKQISEKQVNQEDIDKGTKLTNKQVGSSAALTASAAIGGPSLITKGYAAAKPILGNALPKSLLGKDIAKYALLYGLSKVPVVRDVLKHVNPFD